MKHILEEIINGQEVAIEEIFKLINCYNITSLNIQDANNTVLEMQINHFEAYKDVFEFSQEHTDKNSYVVKQSDILSVNVRWEEEIDSVIAIFQMANNKRMSLIIYYVSSDFRVNISEGYEEIDLPYLEKFLDNALHEDGEYRCVSVSVMDKFSVLLKMTFPQRAYIDTLDDSDWKLHISDNISELNISVVDDICNSFYYTKNDSSVKIVIKPYGQPFMEVRMLFSKRNR